ncbi:MAG: hypothetical protein Q7U16_10400 [Agitococcus sp.]|nr:hypothetical protein [Agitococcus sp.]
MPIVFSAKLDGSNAERRQHYPMVMFYLSHAHNSAFKSVRARRPPKKFNESMFAIIFAAMCLEAFVNERAESVINSDEIDDFLHFRKKYNKPKGEHGVVVKLVRIFDLAFSQQLPQVLLDDCVCLFELRNSLVHYKLEETAMKWILPPVKQEEGMGFCIDFMQRPIAVEAPLVAKINPASAARAYNAARQVIQLWNDLNGAPPESIAGFKICKVRQPKPRTSLSTEEKLLSSHHK